MSNKKEMPESPKRDDKGDNKSPEARILEAPEGAPPPPKTDLKRKRKVDVETVGTIKLPRGTTGARAFPPVAKKGPDSTETKTITAIPPSGRPPKRK